MAFSSTKTVQFIMSDDAQKQRSDDCDLSRPPGLIDIVDLTNCDVDNSLETDSSQSTDRTSQPPGISAQENVKNGGKSETLQYTEDLSQILYQFQQTGYLCDTILVAEDGHLKAHSAVLAAASPVFNSSLNQNANEAVEHVILLPGVDLLTTQIAVRFAYTGHLVVPRQSVSPNVVSKLLATLSDFGLRLGTCLTKIPDNGSKQSSSVPESDNGRQLSTDDVVSFADSARQRTPERCERTSASSKNVKQAKVWNGDNSDALRTEDVISGEADFGRSTAGEDSNVQLIPDEVLYSSGSENESLPLKSTDHNYTDRKNLTRQQQRARRYRKRLEHSSVLANQSKLDKGRQKHSPLKIICEICGKVVMSRCLSLHMKSHRPAHKMLVKAKPENGKQEAQSGESLIGGNMTVDEIKEKYNKAKRMCEICGKVLVSRRLSLHMLTHSLEKPYRCQFCDRCFSLSGNLKRHMNRHTGERPHVCEQCGASFIQQSSLHDHRWSHHRDSIDAEKDPAPFTCRTCGQKFFSTTHLRQHRNNGHQIKAFGAVNARRRYRRCNQRRLIVGQPPYPCPECPEKFTKTPLLVAHALAEHDCRTPFVCPICTKRFSENRLMLAHYRVHTGGRGIHFCPHCDLSFMAVSGLCNHLQRHNPDRTLNFKCGFCSKSFPTRQSLVNHENLHKGIKPFQCTVCGKDYRQSSHLRRHMSVHTGERNYVCSMCEKTYKNLIDLRLHLERIHQLKVPKRPGCKFSAARVEETVAAASDNAPTSIDSIEPASASTAGPVSLLSSASLDFNL